MVTIKRTILFVVVVVEIFSSGTGQEIGYDENKDEVIEVNVKPANADENCNRGKCYMCKCCPGYYLEKATGFFEKDICKKCDCGEDFNCTFKGSTKYCSCPSGYTQVSGKCQEITTVSSTLIASQSTPTMSTFVNLSTLSTKDSTFSKSTARVATDSTSSETSKIPKEGTTVSTSTTSALSTKDSTFSKSTARVATDSTSSETSKIPKEGTTVSTSTTSALSTNDSTFSKSTATVERDSTSSEASEIPREGITVSTRTTPEAMEVWYEVMKKFHMKTAKSLMNFTFHFRLDHM